MDKRCIVVLTLTLIAEIVVAIETEEEESPIKATVFEALEEVGNRDVKSMLHWAIQHSDPDVLKAKAEAAMEQERIPKQEQIERVRELSDFMARQLTETDLMKEAIAVLNNGTSIDAEIVAALESLQILVERIDNANDLKSMDGIGCLIQQLDGDNLRSASAAAVIGVAAANNPKFQSHLYDADPDIISKLLQMLDSTEHQTTGNALYAISSLIRNSEPLRSLFYVNGGLNALHRVLEKSASLRLKRKCLTLLADLIQLGNLSIIDLELTKLVMDLIEDKDWDVSEKAMAALSLILNQSEAHSFMRELDLVNILQKTRGRVQQEMRDAPDRKEYMVEILHSIDTLIHHFQRLQQHAEL